MIYRGDGTNVCKKHVAVFCVFLYTAALLCGCGTGAKKDETGEKPKLVIGSDEYEPYIYVNDEGGYSGIDADLAKEACRRMGYDAEFRIIKWDDKDNYLQGGAVDCLWGSFSMNGREDDYTWVGPYMYSKQGVMVLADSDIYALRDLEGKNIAVQASTKPEEIFLNRTCDNIPNVNNLYCFTEMDELFAAMQKGYVDACAGHETALRIFMTNAPGRYRILEESLFTSSIGVAFAKNADGKLPSLLEMTLEEMKRDGTLENIIETYGISSKISGGNNSWTL